MPKSSSTFGQICPTLQSHGLSATAELHVLNAAAENRTREVVLNVQYNHCVLFSPVSSLHAANQSVMQVNRSGNRPNKRTQTAQCGRYAFTQCFDQCTHRNQSPPSLSPSRNTLFSIHSTMAVVVPTTVFHYIRQKTHLVEASGFDPKVKR